MNAYSYRRSNWIPFKYFHEIKPNWEVGCEAVLTFCLILIKSFYILLSPEHTVSGYFHDGYNGITISSL